MRSAVPSERLEWTNVVLGAGLVCAALTYAEPSVAALNAGIVGSLIVYCSVVALVRYRPWTEWSNVILGCWAVVAPFVLRFASAPTAMWIHIVAGLCVATIAAMQLLAGRMARAPSIAKSAVE